MKAAAKPSILIVGSVALDTVKTPREERVDLLGGSASYASMAASLYAPVRMVGVVGDDFPEAHRALFAARGIDLEGLATLPGKTFRWSGEYEANMNVRRTRLTELNVFEHFAPRLPGRYRESEFVLLANISPSLQLQVLDQIQNPRFVVADTMDLWIEIARPDLLKVLGRVDMLVLNDGEALDLVEETNLIRAGRKILELGPRYVAVKKGEHGCLVFGRGSFFCMPAFPLEEIQDPTGAGDCFVGALMGSLACAEDLSFEAIKEAVLQGTLVASFGVEGFSLQKLEDLSMRDVKERRQALESHTKLP